MKTVADRLIWVRHVLENARGEVFSQRRLSILAGLSLRHVAAIESGELRGHMRSETATALAKVIGGRVGWLMFGEPPAPTEREVIAAIQRAESSFIKRGALPAARPIQPLRKARGGRPRGKKEVA